MKNNNEQGLRARLLALSSKQKSLYAAGVLLIAVLIIVLISKGFGRGTHDAALRLADQKISDPSASEQNAKAPGDTAASESSAASQSEARIPYKLKEKVTVEAGIDGVDIDAFFLQGKEAAAGAGFAGDLSHVDLNVPGRYPLKLLVQGEVSEVILEVEDTIPPVLKLKDLIMPMDHKVKPEEFIEELSDATKVTLSFAEEPLMNKKESQKITVIARDLGGNESRAEATLRFVSLAAKVTVEAGETRPLTLEDFLLDGLEASDVEPLQNLAALDFSSVGTKQIAFLIKGEPAYSYVEVIDTVKPVVKGGTASTAQGIAIPPKALIAEAYDATSLTYEYLSRPDFHKTGTSTVRIRVTDEGGNSVTAEAVLKVVPDTKAPVIYGARDFSFWSHQDPGYLSGVYAADDYDPNPKLTVDASKVNTAVPGSYPVTYTATDQSGNSSRKTITVTVKMKEPYRPGGSTGNAELDGLCDAVLESIIDGDMDAYQQARNIFKWMRRNFVYYRNSTQRRSMVQGGLLGLRQRRGDCFVIRATNQALLNRAGIPNYGQSTADESHAWTMVRLGGRAFVSDPAVGAFDVSMSTLRRRWPDYYYGKSDSNLDKIEYVTAEIPFESVTRENPELPEGEKRTVQEGENGERKLTYKIHYKDGKEVSRELMDEPAVIKEAVDEIIEIGTKKNTPPILSGVKAEHSIAYGENFDFREGVSAYDEEDGPLGFEVDKGGFDPQKPGRYKIVYSAEDSQGFKSEAVLFLTVLPEATTPSTSPSASGTRPEETSGTTEPGESTSEPSASESTAETTEKPAETEKPEETEKPAETTKPEETSETTPAASSETAATSVSETEGEKR